MAAPTLYVVDDDKDFLSAVTFLAAGRSIATETYSNAEDFLASYEPGQPGCALVDLRLPGKSGIDLQAELKERDPDLPFILITGYADIPSAIEVTKGGAFDYIEKLADNDVLVAVIDRAFAHSKSLAPLREARRLIASLTEREHEVFLLLVQGHPNRVIGERLEISDKTVENHRSATMKKLGAQDLSDLINLSQLLGT